jgi:hypothetical protein
MKLYKSKFISFWLNVLEIKNPSEIQKIWWIEKNQKPQPSKYEFCKVENFKWLLPNNDLVICEKYSSTQRVYNLNNSYSNFTTNI